MAEKDKDVVKLPPGMKFVCQEIVNTLETTRYGKIVIIIEEGRMTRFITDNSQIIPTD
jgi:hypothetical protein